jgi:hypothetical protein
MQEKEKKDELINGTSERMNEWMNEHVNERMNMWMNTKLQLGKSE